MLATEVLQLDLPFTDARMMKLILFDFTYFEVTNSYVCMINCDLYIVAVWPSSVDSLRDIYV